ncbi:hypothetical protein ACIRN4_16250 [Pimelobacter simplex]|uniref:hypothetical protein n=1 Tax=Nocardioides simplex TaxID=2045 RepID=UPI0038030C12
MTAVAKCRVPWCVRDSAEECGGDHWSSPGWGDWPDVEATAYQPNGREYVAVGPTWGEIDGLAPAVLIVFSRVSLENVAEMEESFELTPDEAVKVARVLLAAAQAANATTA